MLQRGKTTITCSCSKIIKIIIVTDQNDQSGTYGQSKVQKYIIRLQSSTQGSHIRDA